MKTGTIVVIAILCIAGLIALIFGGMVIGTGNDIVGKRNTVDQLQQVADQETQGLTIMIQQEAVPEAKTEQLTELNSEIDTVERTILHERGVFNQAVKDYNNAIQMFPGAWLNSLMGWNYQPRVGFSASEGADVSPDIDLIP